MIVEDTIKAKALQLLTPYRFDIMAKYIYADQRVRGINSEWAANLYKEHLHIWNNFYEEAPRKNSFEDFKNSFDKLIENLGKEGFKGEESIIPIAYNGSPLNGAHRIAASLVHDLEVQCYLTDEPLAGQLDCSYYFFATRRIYVPTGLTIPLSDAMALQYARMKSNCRLLCFFSHTAANEKGVDEIIMKYGLPVYEKRFNLNEHGRVNLMRQLYKGESWIGERANYFHGARIKASRCFAKGEHMRVMLFDPQSNADLVKMKDEIRQLFTVGKDSIHINDTYEETIRLGEIFFNNNTLVSSNNFHATDRNLLAVQARKIKRACRRQGIDIDSVCLAGPSVLAAYGVHDSSETQLITLDKCPEGFEEINQLVDEAELKRTELIYDPSNYLYFEGVKILALQNAQIINKQDTFSLKKQLRAKKINSSFDALNLFNYSKEVAYIVDTERANNDFLKKYEVEPIFRTVLNGFDSEFLTKRLGNKRDLNFEIVLFHLPNNRDQLPGKVRLNDDQDNYLLLDRLLNKNSINFNQKRKANQFKKFESGFEKLKQILKEQGIDKAEVCVDGSAVLSAYGLRDCNDLDFLYSGLFISTGNKDVDCHNNHFQDLKEQLNLNLSVKDIIFDSHNYFYHEGIKFCSLEILNSIKSKRHFSGHRQQKDIDDCLLINSILDDSLLEEEIA